MTDDELLHALRKSKGWPTLGNAAADRIEELETKLDKAVDFCRRLERFAQGTNDQFLLDRCREILGELTDARPD
jgi:hypothetical protein